MFKYKISIKVIEDDNNLYNSISPTYSEFVIPGDSKIDNILETFINLLGVMGFQITPFIDNYNKYINIIDEYINE